MNSRGFKASILDPRSSRRDGYLPGQASITFSVGDIAEIDHIHGRSALYTKLQAAFV